MKILFLTTVIPNNVKTGGEIVSHQYIESLRTSHEVFALAYQRSGETVRLDSDDHVVAERVIETKASKLWFIIWLVLSFFNKRPYSSQKFYSRKYVAIVKTLFKDNNFDLVVVDHSQLSWAMDFVPSTVPAIFNSHNVEYLVYRELATQGSSRVKKFIYARESKLMKLEEAKLLKGCDQVWVLSNSDKNDYTRIVDKRDSINVTNVPGGFKKLVECEKIYDIGILGTWTWESNKKGLEWFLNKILPLIDIDYSVSLGGKGSLEYKNIYSNVRALGIVDDAQIFLSSCRVLVIPTIAGGGIQIKTLDSISTNRPVVTTSVGVRGICPVPDSVFVQDDIKSFSNKINELLGKQEEFDVGFSWASKRRDCFTSNLNSFVEATKL